MTITELHIQIDLQPENRIDILKDAAFKCRNGYHLFIDSIDGHCYLFDEDGNKDDVNKLKKIDNGLFYYSNIKSIEIPDSVKSIGNGAFWNCQSLKSIEIPDSVESIGDYAFGYCKSMKSLTFKGKTIDQVKEMENYPFGIKDESIIRCT